MKKRIMILGAGPFQLSAITKAKEQGYYIITVDNVPNNLGHEISDLQIDCSTIEKEKVLRFAEKNKIDGIVTFASDIAVPTVGSVCDKMGLCGVSEHAAITMSNKEEFRKFQKTCSLDYPEFYTGDNFVELKQKIVSLRFPIIVKPVDTSGSRGITKIEIRDYSKLRYAFDIAKSYSRSGIVCCEEFLEGVEVGGDGILKDGKFVFIAVTQKHLDKFIVKGHSFPTNITNEQLLEVKSVLEKTCCELGYKDGPLNFDVMVNNNHAMIIEMSARNGGNGIPLLIDKSYDFDIESAVIKIALGEPFNIVYEEGSNIKPYSSFVFGSQHSGKLLNIADKKEIQTFLPNIEHIFYKYKIGDSVPCMEHNGNLIGFLLFRNNGDFNYEEICNKYLKELKIEVDRI